MRGKSLRASAIILAAMLVLVLAVVPAYAQSGSGNSGGAANGSGSNGYGMNAWHTLQAGQHDEWVLLYTGGDNTTATVSLNTDGNNAVKFDVYTDQQWTSRGQDATITPIGRGTQTTSRNNEDNTVTVLNNGDLTWQVHNTAGNKFHLDVYSNSNQPVRYWINVTGDGNGGFSLNRGNNGAQFVQSNNNTNANAGAVANANAGAAGASVSGTASATTGGNTATGGQSSAAVAQAQTGATAGPRFLPRTGGADSAVIWLFGIGLALVAGGWIARRKSI